MLYSLPKTVLRSDSVAVFKFRLKTFLFSQAFSSFSAHLHAAWPQRSEVTTLWRYTDLFIIIIIIRAGVDLHTDMTADFSSFLWNAPSINTFKRRMDEFHKAIMDV